MLSHTVVAHRHNSSTGTSLDAKHGDRIISRCIRQDNTYKKAIIRWHPHVFIIHLPSLFRSLLDYLTHCGSQGIEDDFMRSAAAYRHTAPQ